MVSSFPKHCRKKHQKIHRLTLSFANFYQLLQIILSFEGSQASCQYVRNVVLQGEYRKNN